MRAPPPLSVMCPTHARWQVRHVRQDRDFSSEDRAIFGKMLEEVEEWLFSEEADEGTKVMSCHGCTLYFAA